MENSKDIKEQSVVYENIKLWRLIAWPMGESGRILFLMLMILLSFYATGIAGLGVVLVGTLITATRILDGITDPLMGLWIDKTQGRFGKVRPFAIGSWIVMVGCAFLIFFTTHHIPESFRVVYFVLIYILYMMGYSTLGMSFGVANPIITKDPKKRPIIFGLSMGYTTTIGAGFGMFLASVAPRHGGFGSAGLFHELWLTFTLLSAVMFIASMVAIWKLDVPENFGNNKKDPVKVKDMISTLKGNRPFQLFMITNITDRLSQNIANHQVINVMIFGIIIGDFAITGAISGIMLVPNLLVLLFGMRLVGKIGAKKAYIYTIWSAMAFGVLLPLLLIFGEPTLIRFDRIGFMTVAFVILNFGFSVSRLLSNMCVGPMTPDIIDYETYRSGKFAPGVIVAVNSFIDKFVTSLYQAIVAIVVAMIGFTETLPDLDTPLTNEIFAVAIFLGFGVLIFSWILSLICMKFYPLDRAKMEEIQAELKRRKEEQEAQEAFGKM